MRNISVYLKEIERLDKRDIEGAKKYKGILRVECQIKKKLIKKELRVNGISQDVDNWFSENAFICNYLKLLKNLLYEGDYYRIDKARNIVHVSDVSDVMKNRLSIFLTRVNKLGLNGIKKQYSATTVKKYIEVLEKMGVIPICFDSKNDIECINGVYERCKKVAEQEYFR